MAKNDGLSSYAELADVLASLPLIAREMRRARGISLRAAAQEVGVSFSTLHRIESGEDCVASHLIAVMRWIDQATTKEGSTPGGDS